MNFSRLSRIGADQYSSWPDAQHELVVLQQLGAEFEVGVDAVVERVAVRLGPLDERQLPVAELRRQRAVERHAAALDLVPAVVGVEAVPAPVGVGVVGVGRELKEDLRVLPRFFGPDDEESLGCDGLGVLDFGRHHQLVVTRAPRSWNLNDRHARPTAAVGRGVLGDRVRVGLDPEVHTGGHPVGADADNLEVKRSRLGRNMEFDLVAFDVAQLIGVALDDRALRFLSNGREGQRA